MTQTNPYAVLKEFDVAADRLQEVTDVLKELQTNALAAEGCYAYEILQSEENPEKLFLYECYENALAHSAYTDSDYFMELVRGKLNILVRGKRITKVVAV